MRLTPDPPLKKGLTAFEEYLDTFAIIFRCTDKPNSVVNFRFFFRRRIDTIAISAQAGLIKLEDPLAKLISSWSSLSQSTPEQWGDFDPRKGLAKTRVYFPEAQSINDILFLSELPASVRQQAPVLQGLGLENVIFTAIDYEGRTMNFYFLVLGVLSADQAVKYTDLVECLPSTEQELQDMEDLMGPFVIFAVTVEYETGWIARVAFYAMNVPKLPTVDERLVKFYKEAPSYDRQRSMIVAWSYGRLVLWPGGFEVYEGRIGVCWRVVGCAGNGCYCWLAFETIIELGLNIYSTQV
ncbi:MAG: hypothetical protein Q9227_007268 [Pyrenula ochraceoflavens]